MRYVQKCSTGRQATYDTVIWCMQFAGWLTKATYTHSEYVILIAFLQQQWLHKCVSMLCSTYIATLDGLMQRFPTWVTNLNIGDKRRNWIMVERGTYVISVRKDKFEITGTILITNILLIWRVQFMEIGCWGVRKWKKVGKHWSSALT